MSALEAVRSKTESHINAVFSNRSELRTHIDPKSAENDQDLLAEIGYKQELVRSYSVLQIFGIAFSIMGLLPSISSTIATGLEGGPASLVWGWFCAGFFILCIGFSMSELVSSIPTSGGLYYWTNYYAPESIRVPLSFLIGCSNTMALTAGLCSIDYGFALELLSAVYINKDGDFNITNGITYGVFAACVVSHILLCSVASGHASKLQSFSIYVNVFVIILFFIAVPIGSSGNFKDAKFIFGELDNSSGWSQGWQFMLSWMPAIWTIGAFDSCVHMSEEAKNASRGIPIGIIGSITVCWIVGWCICIVSAACITDLETVLSTPTGQVMAQIIYDSLGKKWAVAFMSLIAFAQYLMGSSILTASSRQIYAFARDDGLPIVYNYVKVVNVKLKVPLRAVIFGGLLALVLGLLVLINATAANALFSLAVAGNYLSWGTPVFLRMTSGRHRFKPGVFYLGDTMSYIINSITCVWIVYVIIMSMFPSTKSVDQESMNYTCVINVGVWILSLIYYFAWGYKCFSGPRSNLGENDMYSNKEAHGIDGVLIDGADGSDSTGKSQIKDDVKEIPF